MVIFHAFAQKSQSADLHQRVANVITCDKFLGDRLRGAVDSIGGRISGSHNRQSHSPLTVSLRLLSSTSMIKVPTYRPYEEGDKREASVSYVHYA